jgi:ribosomal protein S6--L-glutamate ligase
MLGVVRQFEMMGLPVVNGFQAIIKARNKFFSLQTLVHAGIPVPDSRYVGNLQNFEKAVQELGGYPVVVKRVRSRQGEGVVLVESISTAAFIFNNLPKVGHGILVQEYIAPVGRKDIRAFILGEQVVAAMEVRPKQGDFRSNIHLEGQGGPLTLEKDLSDLALRSTMALGLEISGADIILDAKGEAKVIEVNYSPGFKGLEAATGQDIASLVIGYVVDTCGESRGNRISDG